MTHCNEHLEVELIEPKGILSDIPQLPVPLERMKRCWRDEKDGAASGLVWF